MFRTLAAAALALALTATTANAQDTYKLGINISSHGTHSVKVDKVLPGSLAEQMGIRLGDVIYGINGGSTNDPFAFRDAVFGSDRVTLNIQRGNRLYNAWARFNDVPQLSVPVAVIASQTTEVTK